MDGLFVQISRKGMSKGFPESELASFWGFSRSGGGVSSLHECARRQLRTKLIVCRGLLPSFALEFNKSSQARLKFQCKCHLPPEGGFGTNRPFALSFEILNSPIKPNLYLLSNFSLWGRLKSDEHCKAMRDADLRSTMVPYG